jgi:hypothetical protein
VIRYYLIQGGLAAALLWASGASADRFPTRDQLNDAGRSVWADDTADVLKPRELLYESKTDGRYRVSYNLIREQEGDVKGYFVRLTITNLSGDAVVAPADVTLTDAENTVIAGTDRETFLALAATLADTKVPTTAYKPTAHTTPGEEDFGQSYLLGQSEGRILKATDDVIRGRKMTVWADSFWLKPSLEIPARARVSGVRVFLAEPYHPLPLRLFVRIGSSDFEFTTRAK